MRLPTRRLAVLPLLLLAPLAAGCGESDDDKGGSGTAAADAKCATVPEGAVAIVDCQPIKKAEFDHLLAIGIAQLKQQGQTVPKAGSPEYESLRERVLQRLVVTVELEQEAKKRGIKVDPNRTATDLKNYKRDCCKGKEAEYQKYLKKTSLTEQDIKDNSELNQISEALYKDVTKDAKFTFPENRRVAHILFDVAPQGKVTAADRQAAEKVLAQLKAGGNFAALAKKHSTDPGSKDKGGEYLEKKGEFDPAFEKAAFALKTGELTETPVKTPYGYHIIKALGDMQPARQAAVSAAKTPEEQQLAEQAKQEAANKWFAGIEKEYAKKTRFAPGYRIKPAPDTTSSTGATATTGATTTGR
jgi:peptidyl-prolyl cis-trans isomerase C